MGCNWSKYTHTTGVDPITGHTAPLYHPRRDEWREHFAWTSDGLMIVGLTETERATVVRLALNRHGVVNLRRLLAETGEYSAGELPDNRRERP